MAATTWLDRAIGWASPSRGVRRAAARSMMDMARSMGSLAYEGARGGRRTEGWVATSTSADTETVTSLTTLRDRARDLVRNNAYARRAIEVKAANTIGTGITAEVKNRRLRGRWDTFVKTCDADEAMDLYGLLNLVERCRFEAGEALIQFLPSRLPPGGVPFQLRVLEPDYLDSSRDGAAPGGDGIIRHGIEYDAFLRPVAYWLFPEHPGNSWSSTMRLQSRGWVSERVVADDIIHVYRKLRAGQSRGVTEFAPVILPMRDLDDYDDAEVMRKKVEACVAMFITSAMDLGASSVGQIVTPDEAGNLERLFPGMIKRLRHGESITMADPKSSGGYAEFERFGLRKISAGTGIPYELMTGDLSQINYSSSRVGLVDFRRRVEQDQWLLYVPRVCERIADRFRREVALVLGEGAGDRTAFKWTPPRFELVDPLKETQAEIESCVAGFDTWEEIVRRRGWTASEQLEKIAAWQKELDRLGVVVKSDYRTAVAAKAPAAPEEPPEEPSPASEPAEEDEAA